MLAAQDYRRALLAHPFWERLSPTAVQQRVDQLLDAPNSVALVRALPPVEYVVLLKLAPESRALLLAVATPEQVRTVLDLDCWHKDIIQSERVIEWLEDLQQSGEGPYRRALNMLDSELLWFAFRQHIRVHGALPSEEDDDPRAYDEILSNELYRVDFVDEDSPLNERIKRLLDFLRRTAMDSYYSLMQGLMWASDSELQEWAYRWRSGRLQDEGFPDYYEALEAYYTFDAEAPSTDAVPALPGLPASAEETGVIPSYAWSMTPSGSFLARALQGDFDLQTLERLCWEMVVLCNRELVIAQVDFADAAAVRASLQRVHRLLNVGLEFLSGHNTQQLGPLLTTRSLQTIFQRGVSLTWRLHQRAVRLQSYLQRTASVQHTLPGLARQVLDGLLRDPPEFFEGLATPGVTGYRDFLHHQDVTLADAVLQHLESDPAYRAASSSHDVSSNRLVL